jgi:hypothetical protein
MTRTIWAILRTTTPTMSSEPLHRAARRWGCVGVAGLKTAPGPVPSYCLPINNEAGFLGHGVVEPHGDAIGLMSLPIHAA